MRPRLVLLAAAILFCTSLSAQRDLEFIEDINNQNRTIVLGGRVLLAGHGDQFLTTFSDDGGVGRLSLPFDGSVRLRNSTQMRPAVYNSNAWFVLWNGTTRFLYRFNGITFTRVTITGSIVSSPVVFGSNLYFLTQSGSTIQLYRYNGVSITAVSSGTIPATSSYDLKVAGGFLYLIGRGYYASEPYTVKRYNGVSFTTLPHFTFFSGISEIFAVGSNAYFQIGYSTILYYNGTSISTVYDVSGSIIHAALWRSNLYFLSTIEFEAAVEPLRRVNAGVLSAITMPAGARLYRATDIAMYNDALYFTATYSETDNRVLRYNGAFSDFFTIPGRISQAGTVFTRAGDLVIQPEFLNRASCYEYDGTTFTELRVPPEKYFANYLNSTDCNHLWLGQYYDEEDPLDPYRWGLMKESICPPPDTPVIVVPERMFDFERADLSIWGKDRGWCWNEIIIDWIVEPCDFPDPCPDPGFAARLFDKDKQMAFEKKISKPSAIDIPLSDDQAYITRISSTTGQQEDLFVFADNLVEKGIESIKLSMKPGDGFFKLEATTDIDVKVGLRVELLGKSGEVLWQKDFMAPFSEEITDKVNEPGQTLRFSIPGTKNKTMITNLHISPNPSKGLINLQVKSAVEIKDAELSVSTLLGQQVSSRKIQLPFSQQIRLNDIRPGMYVLKIITGSDVQSRIIRIE
jgi:hypothetical protein